jgi:hypothetical protein
MGVTTGTVLNEQLLMAIRSHIDVHIEELTAGELAWTLWALGKMQVQFQDMATHTQNKILACIRMSMISMTSREQGVSFWAMTRMSIPLNELSGEDRSAIVFSIEELAMRSLAANQNKLIE